MKKLVLFFITILSGLVTMATEWSDVKKVEGAQIISLPYSWYGNNDNGSGETSHTWQSGNTSIINNALKSFSEEEFDRWYFEYGEQFSFTVTGTCNASGKFKTGIVDEQPEANYWFPNSAFANPEIEVEAGKEFSI
ncbi:MAG: hypothetical protein J6V74_01150, partial [Bacteroidales bacterium]|nr:hypothetical protein [Bacteroidales bacterium]